MVQRLTTVPLRPQAASASRTAARPQLDTLLLSASKQPRSHTSEGREPLLTATENSRLRASLAAAPKAVVAEVLGLAAGFRGEAAPVASALLLRAASARGDQLKGPGAEKSLQTLRAFATQIRGLDATTLRERATVLDLDSGKNDSLFDAQGLWERRGTVRASAADTAADNDGLLQRFTSTCGPTVLQMLMAEADPVLAFAINQEGRASASAKDGAARFQRAVLEEFGGIGIPRVESHLAARLKNGLGQLVRSGEVTAGQRDALVRHATARGPLDARAKTALEAMRERYEGFPADDELKQLKTAILPARDEGLGTVEFQRALEKYASVLTGLGYQMTEPADGFGRGDAKKHLDAVEAALKKGADVPFGVSEPAHWMLLTASRRVDGAREFLVSDPDGGKTAWVKERDFVSGTFGDKQFQLSRPDERPYVDCFFLPKK